MGDKILVIYTSWYFLQCSITEQTDSVFAGTEQRTASGLGRIVGSLVG